jgi:predicted aminopeptidase
MDQPINNATLIGTRLYYRRLDLFEEVWARHGRDLPSTIAAILSAIADGGDPWQRVDALVASLPAARN